ncbi:unnamed protein product [Owenia fusiformis]|uniref:Cytochrome P450 n=1 Tax=Owenia fusiformis TaxID=6347 RepID=A0A8S4PYP1_OWEFU|nr:unnamed protein product [Owenia fusiformis]
MQIARLRTFSGKVETHQQNVLKTAHHETNVCQYEKGRPFDTIPGPKGVPVFGTLFQYTRGPYSIDTYPNALVDRYYRYGPIFKETIAAKTRVHIFDPEEIKKLYATEENPHIPPLLETVKMYRKYRDMSPGLGNVNGEEWYRLRSSVQKLMMQPVSTVKFLPMVNEVVADFIKRMYKIRASTGEINNFNFELSKFIYESSTYTCFEKRQQILDDEKGSHTDKLLACNRTMLELSTKLKFQLPFFKYISTPTWRKLVASEDFFYRFGLTLVDETVVKMNELAESGDLKNGQYEFLSYLLGRRELSYKDVSILTLSMFNDGLSTTSPSLVWQLYCISRHPEKQEKLYEEVKDLSGKSEPISAQTLTRLPYLKACVKEGFRLFPIAPDVTREPTKDTVISGYQIPKGTYLSLNNNLLLRLPEYFAEPNAYKPERWIRGDSTDSIHPYVVLPFGHGTRMCVGRRFAEQEIYVMLIKLLQHFKIEWNSCEEMGRKFRTLFTPSTEAKFKFIPRE